MSPSPASVDISLDRYFPDSEWRQLLTARDALTLGRSLTLIECGLASSSFLLNRAERGSFLRGRTIGITGPPGAGKSTLIGALISAVRGKGETIAVLAVDPSSPHSGGALLGDRLRMGMARDSGLFIRSVASRGHLGGTAPGAAEAIDFLSALFDNVIVETVGAGQSEVEIQSLVSTCIVVCVPGLGDEVQMSKAGILEVADILVVNQADKPGSSDTVRQLKQIFSGKPVLDTVATSGRGVDALFEACVSIGYEESVAKISPLAARRGIDAELARGLLLHYSGKAGAEAWEKAVNQVQSGEPPRRAAADLLRRITTEE